jgi:hypothetical protein
VTPRSASSSASGLEVIEEPRSAWMLSCPRGNALLRAGRGDQLPGQGSGLAAGGHPADDVAAVDVQDHVQVVIGSFRRAVRLGDVPRPALVRSLGYEPGLDRSGAGGPRAPLAAFAGLAQHPVVGGHRPQVGARIQQRRPDFIRRGVLERPLCSTFRIAGRSAGASARGWTRSACGTRAGLGSGGLIRCRRYQVACAQAGRRARRPGADPRRHHGDRPVGHELDPGSVSAPSEIVYRRLQF